MGKPLSLNSFDIGDGHEDDEDKEKEEERKRWEMVKKFTIGDLA
jgi:hypothetical protein